MSTQASQELVLVMAFLQSWPFPDGPTIREIQSGCELASPATAHRRLSTLVDQGRVVVHTQRPSRVEVVG